MADDFQVTLVTPQQQVFDERAKYASVPAWDGLLGVAVQRAPLLVKLGYGPLRVDLPDGGSRRFYVGGGFAQMLGDKLTLLSEEASPADEIDRAETQRELDDARKSGAGDESSDDRQRAAARLSVADQS